MKTSIQGSDRIKKYSLLIGLSVIISIMISSFIYSSTQIQSNKEALEELLRARSDGEQALNGKSVEILKRSQLLVEELGQFLTENNQNNPALSYTLLKIDHNDNSLNRNITNRLLHRIIPALDHNLALIETMNDEQFWESQEAAGKAFNNFDETIFNIQILKIVTVMVTLILTFFILKNQKMANRKLAYQANTDMLTLLPNRSRQIKNIQNQIKSKPESFFAVVFIDIDYFKIINDNYGHDIGDIILNKFAAQIKAHLKEGDILSRFGGDEFVLLLRSMKSKKQTKKFIKKLSSALDTSFLIDNTEIFITASIGVSFYTPNCPDDKCNNPKILLKHADIAMYSAKQIGRNSFRFFSQETKDRIETEHNICHALHTILRNKDEQNELYLKYQPLLNIREEEVTECEALIRWKTIEGEISPDEFIPLAEKNNLIEKVNLFVINQACLQQYKWQQSKQKPMRININLSGNKLVFSNLIARLKHNLHKYKLEPSLFGIELTERTISEISKDTLHDLELLRKNGMKISIDDFGTGYSSLSELKNLPVTTLKIDKAFIKGLPYDKKDHALVKTIIDLGHSLNLDIVAEGVENIEQHLFLKKHSCNVGQGYFYQKPLHGDGMENIQMHPAIA